MDAELAATVVNLLFQGAVGRVGEMLTEAALNKIKELRTLLAARLRRDRAASELLERFWRNPNDQQAAVALSRVLVSQLAASPVFAQQVAGHVAGIVNSGVQLHGGQIAGPVVGTNLGVVATNYQQTTNVNLPQGRAGNKRWGPTLTRVLSVVACTTLVQLAYARGGLQSDSAFGFNLLTVFALAPMAAVATLLLVGFRHQSTMPTALSGCLTFFAVVAIGLSIGVWSSR